MSEEDRQVRARAPHDGRTHLYTYNGVQDDGAGGGIHLWTTEDGYTHSAESMIDATLDAIEEGSV